MRVLLAAAFIATACVAAPAAPLDVTFPAVVVDTCTVTVATPGVMVMSTDGTILGSDQPLGVPATVTVLSIGSNNVSLSAPTLVSYPAGYTPGGETLQINSSGLFSNPLFTSLGLNFAVGLLPVTNLLVNLKVTNPSGFKQGLYTAKTVLTCS